MNFEDVYLNDVRSVGEYIMQSDYNLGISFHNYNYSNSEDVNDAVLECALKIMAWQMRLDNESEAENVNDLFQIWQGEPNNPDRYEDYDVAKMALEQHEDELRQVESAINELQENYAAIVA